MLTKQEILLARGARTESSRVKEPRTVLPRGSQSWFYGMGLVSGLSLVSPSDSESFLVVYTLLSQGGCQ